MIVTADIHLKAETEAIVFDEVLPGLVQEARRLSLSCVAVLGDVYHVRYQVSVALQNRLYHFLRQSPVCWILMPGNHDQINPAGEHALEVFGELDNVEVISQPGWKESGLWIPYRKDPGEIAKALRLPKATGYRAAVPSVAWMHHGVRGALMNDHIRDQEGIPLEEFGGFEHVYCGHYHKPQTVGNVTYIGSPYQTRADEADQQKYIGVWDPVQGMHTIPVSWGRKYHRLEVTTDSPLVLPDYAKPGDEIRVRAGSGVDPEALAGELAKQGFVNVTVTPVQQAQAARLQVGVHQSVAAYAQAYVDQFAGATCDLDTGRLMDLYRQLTE